VTATERISYEIHADDSHSRGEVDLPSWCAGDPHMAIALYFFGERTSVGFVTRAEVVATPNPEPEDSDDFPVPGLMGACDDDDEDDDLDDPFAVIDPERFATAASRG